MVEIMDDDEDMSDEGSGWEKEMNIDDDDEVEEEMNDD